MTQYLYPESLDETLTFLEMGKGKARILAGGTDLMTDIRKGSLRPETIIDITHVAELGQIEIKPGFLTIGPAVSFAVIKSHPFLKDHVAVLSQAAASIGAGGIQQTATLAGNIVQAMPAADGAVAALALEAQALVCSPQEKQWIPIHELYQGPGKSAVDPTKELISAIRFPIPQSGEKWGTAWQRIGRRAALILPIMNCAVKIHFDNSGGDSSISKALIALGPAGAVPFTAVKAAHYLIGREPDQKTFTRAGRLAGEEAQPRSSPLRASKEYRQKIIPVLVRDALLAAVKQSTVIP